MGKLYIDKEMFFSQLIPKIMLVNDFTYKDF